MFNGGNDGFTMPVTPLYGGGNGNGSFLGGDGIWAILLFALLFGNGGWGFGGFGGGMGGFAADGAMLYPWMNQAEITTDGFRDQMLQSTIQGVQNSVTSGFGDTALGIAGINQNICQTGTGITAAVTNGFAQSEIADNARQIANMQQAFNAQTAVTGGLTNLSSQFSECLNNTVGTLAA